MLLEFVSDPVCPWCWLGFNRTLNALHALTPKDRAKIVLKLRPFELDANVPKGGISYSDYMLDKFKDSDKLEQIKTTLMSEGKAEGLDFDFDAIKIRPNSRDSHRLIRWAQGQDLGEASLSAIFSAYHSEGRNISDRSVLVAIAQDIGLVGDVVDHLLQQDSDVDEVQDEITFFRQIGVSGVPVLIADRALAMMGAQDSTAIVEFLQRALEYCSNANSNGTEA